MSAAVIFLAVFFLFLLLNQPPPPPEEDDAADLAWALGLVGVVARAPAALTVSRR